ncbi:tape measure protein [Jeotgalibaca porci]|uniref:tape measure protein n=1 Tax=Jeotgalibaca porci TaxID=1868793 RepID=UPI0035A0BF69
MAENPPTGGTGSGGSTSLQLTDRVSGTINKIVNSFERLINTAERVNQTMVGVDRVMSAQANGVIASNSRLVDNVQNTEAQVRSSSDELLNAFEAVNMTDFRAIGSEMGDLATDSSTLKKATGNVNQLSDATLRMNDILGKVKNTSLASPMKFDQNPLDFETTSTKLVKMSENVNQLSDATQRMNAVLGKVKNTSLQAPIEFDQNPLGFESMSSKLAKMSENLAKIRTDIQLTPVFESITDLDDIPVEVVPTFNTQGMSLEDLEVAVIPNFESAINTNLEPIDLPVMPQLPEWNIAQPEAIKVPLLFDDSGLDSFAPPEFEPIPLEMEWLPIEQPEVFLTDGLTRYQQEMASANLMLERASQSQANLNALARELRASPAIMSDFQTMQNRINGIQQSIANLEPIDGVISPGANNQIESLRANLQSLLRTQDEVANGLSDVNTEAAHAAYNRLNTQVGQIERQIRENTTAQSEFNSTVEKGVGSSNKLVNTLRNVAVAIGAKQAVQSVVGLSDSYSQTIARLDLMNDGLQTTAELQNMVFASAQRSRMEYQATADMVGKLGTLAGEAFSGSGEIVQFAELINKQFALAGTSAQEASGATLQLTQALASGVLRGDELNSVMEQAPTIIQAIADYLGVTKGEIRELASDGEITAEIVKNAMFAAADDINEKFASMPKTWSQIWTSFKNYALEAFEPVLQRVNDLANSKAVEQFVTTAVSAMYVVSNVVVGIMDVIGGLMSFIGSQWAWLGPILMTFAALLLLHYGRILIIRSVTMAAAAAQWAWNAAIVIYQAITGSAWMMTIALIAIVIGAIYAATGAFSQLTGIAVSGLGMVMGTLYLLWDVIMNIVIAIMNVVIGVVNFIVNLFQAGIFAVQLLWYGLGMAVALVAFGILFVVQAVVNGAGKAWEAGINFWNQLWFGFKMFVGEMLVGMLEGVSGFINSAVNGFSALKYEASKVWYNIAQGAGNMATAIAQGIDGMINGVISGIEGMLNAVLGGINDMISALDKIPGVSIGPIGQVTLGRANNAGKLQNFLSGLTAPVPDSRGSASNIDLGAGLRDSLANMKMPEMAEWENVDYTSGLQNWILDNKAPEAPEQWIADYIDFKDLSGSFGRGYAQGESWEGKLSQMLEEFKTGNAGTDIADMFNDLDMPEVPAAPEVGGGGNNPTGGKLDSVGEIEDEIEMDEETLNLIRDVAKQKWQQNYITMTPQVTTNIESINTEQEYEDFIAQFNDDLLDAIHDGVEGLPV